LVVQVAVSALLLVGAGLFVRTLYNLQRVNLGFNQENLLIFAVQPELNGYKDEKLFRFYPQLFDRLDHLPGVHSATFGKVPLIANDNWFFSFLFPGEVEGTAPERDTMRQVVRENYFATMEIPLLRGRGFTAQDDSHAAPVAIVSQTFQQQFFPNEDVLGKHVIFNYQKHDVEIVGVVADTKYQSQRKEIEPLLYTPWRQEAEEVGVMHFTLRTMNDPTALSGHVRAVVRDLDNNLPVTEIGTQSARSEKTLAQERLYARLFSFFGVLALVLAGIGLFGVLAYSVSQRTQEIGVRMAFGAQVRNVISMVVWQGMKLVLVGLSISALAGYALVRLLNSKYFGPQTWQQRMKQQLYGVAISDPLTLIVIALLLALVALIACWLPARRAANVDPLVALRYE
jgi:predicted permease